MNIRSLICHFVFVLVIFASIQALANGPACSLLFSLENQTLDILEPGQKDAYTQSQNVMQKLTSEGVLTKLRTVNPSKDHVDFFAAQLPIIANKLTVKIAEALPTFQRLNKIPHGREKAVKFMQAKLSLESSLKESYKMLLGEAAVRFESETVTYEWYMGFFLKAMIFTDVSMQIMDATSANQFKIMKHQLDTVTGRSKMFNSSNLTEIRLYSALGKEFSTLTKDAYFTRNLLEHTLVPVLFVPKDVDIIQAERLGIHFVTLVTMSKERVNGLTPIQFAARQVEQRTQQTENFRDLINNNRAKWIRFHDKVAIGVKGQTKLEALYAFVLRDAGLQSEITKRFETGYRLLFSFNDHRASEFLENYFKSNEATVRKIADQDTVDSFLKIVYQIEKDALASQ